MSTTTTSSTPTVFDFTISSPGLREYFVFECVFNGICNENGFVLSLFYLNLFLLHNVSCVFIFINTVMQCNGLTLTLNINIKLSTKTLNCLHLN